MARLFTDVVGELGRGSTVADLTTKLAEVVVGVMETGKIGSLTLTLKIKPNGRDSVFVIDDVKAKVPELPRSETLFIATAGGDLTRDIPDERGPREAVRGPRLAGAEG